jgi:hypothetical protein
LDVLIDLMRRVPTSDDEDGKYRSMLVLNGVFLQFCVLLDDIILENLNMKEFSDWTYGFREKITKFNI